MPNILKIKFKIQQYIMAAKNIQKYFIVTVYIISLKVLRSKVFLLLCITLLIHPYLYLEKKA